MSAGIHFTSFAFALALAFSFFVLLRDATTIFTMTTTTVGAVSISVSALGFGSLSEHDIETTTEMETAKGTATSRDLETNPIATNEAAATATTTTPATATAAAATASDLRDALAWMVKLWECTETSILISPDKDSAEQQSTQRQQPQRFYYSRLVCTTTATASAVDAPTTATANRQTGLEIGLFVDEKCAHRVPDKDYFEELLLPRIDDGDSDGNNKHNNNNNNNSITVYYYSILSKVGLLSHHPQNDNNTIQTIHLTKSMQPVGNNNNNNNESSSAKDQLRPAVEWMQSYRYCKKLHYSDYTFPVLYTQLVCNPEGTGLEIGLFHDDQCHLYTPLYNFKDYLDRKKISSNDNDDNNEPDRIQYNVLVEAGLIVTKKNARADFYDAVRWLTNFWDCTDTNATMTTSGQEHPIHIYSQLRCKDDGSGIGEIALFSDDQCKTRVPPQHKLSFFDVFPCQSTNATTAHYLEQISKYSYLLDKFDEFECSSWLSEIDAASFSNENDVTTKHKRQASRVGQELSMRALIRTTGIEVTKEDPRVKIFLFPQHNGKPYDACYGDRPEEDKQELGDDFTTWIFPNVDDDYTDEMDSLYDDMGNRSVMESYLRDSWDVLADDFLPIPETATWSLQRVEGDLMPILQDETFVYFLGPTSAKVAPSIGEVSMPTPYEARIPIEGVSPGFFTDDIWLEECDDGGVYVLGLDDTVLLYYIDSPFGLILNRFRCHKDQWERMWTSAFGTKTKTIRIETSETVEDLVAAYQKKGFETLPTTTTTTTPIRCIGTETNTTVQFDSSKADNIQGNGWRSTLVSMLIAMAFLPSVP